MLVGLGSGTRFFIKVLPFRLCVSGEPCIFFQGPPLLLRGVQLVGTLIRLVSQASDHLVGSDQFYKLLSITWL